MFVKEGLTTTTHCSLVPRLKAGEEPGNEANSLYILDLYTYMQLASRVCMPSSWGCQIGWCKMTPLHVMKEVNGKGDNHYLRSW